MKQTRFRLVIPLAFCFALTPPASAEIDLPELGASAETALPWHIEKRIGQDIMNQIRMREPSYLDDPEIETYLNALGERLAAAAPEAGGGFHFFAILDPTINAFAMLGGFIGVHTGLILNVQNESELASVLAHEISHVTQRHLSRGIEKQKQASAATMLMMALALLAAHSNSNMAEAAMAASTATAMQTQLNYTRAFEREADRFGFQILARAGFDPHAMSAFFERLQKATRAYENNAPVYLRTHPLNVERISDMQNREQSIPYRQVLDEHDFHLTRARLQAQQGTPDEAVERFRHLLAEKRFASLAATHYGLAVALERQKDWDGVEKALDEARASGPPSAMIERLAAEASLHRNAPESGLRRYRNAIARFPAAPALAYGYAEALLRHGKREDGLRFLEDRLRVTPDARLYRIKARIHAENHERARQHHAQGEAYALEGALDAAIEQMELAQKSPGGDFYEQSTVDARLRQLKRQKADESRLSLP